MRLSVRGGLPLLACAAAAAGAQPAPPEPAASLTAAVVHRRLVERADDGTRLLTESGPMLRVEGEAQLRLGDGALRAAAAAAGGELDYEGRTQGGAPLGTRTSHRDLELGLQWRPLPPAAWGEAWLVLRVLQQRRQISSTAIASGLRETSTYVLPGLRWSLGFDAAGWQWRGSVELRASAHHRLDVDFGGAFDAADLKGGRRQEIVLGLEGGPAGSPWRWGLAWSHTRQSASPLQPLLRAGVAAGTVRQPRIRIDDAMLRVGRAF